MARERRDVIEALRTHWHALSQRHLRDLFAEDPGRFADFSLSAAGLHLDYSKNRVTRETIALLTALAEAAGIASQRDAMLAGAPINTTEGRSVLHTALRAPRGTQCVVEGHNVITDVHDVLDRAGAFARAVREGAITTSTGGRFTDVVNIGIGGSDLGPAMVTRALRPYHDGPRLHFVSNVDGAHIADTLATLAPETTLFVIASKTFTTLETMTNAATARRFIVDKLGQQAVANHFAAISTNLGEVERFGIRPERTFGFWDWVGGRYSVWSAIGLPVMIAVGADRFGQFLAGAHAMDEHFRTAPLEVNMPALMGLVGAFHRNVCGWPTLAVLPYDQRLERFPAYLQQLDMESNGKSVARDGSVVAGETGPIVWGEPGTNGQHAFFQLLHQGTTIVPCDFLVAANAHEAADGPMGEHHLHLLANCLAQSQALMRGRTLAEARDELVASGLPPHQIDALAPHKVFPGNRPSSTIVYDRLDPATLGALIALYEHKVFVQAGLWGINAFDQWGVELGKSLARELFGLIAGTDRGDGRDASTAGLLATIRRLRARD